MESDLEGAFDFLWGGCGGGVGVGVKFTSRTLQCSPLPPALPQHTQHYWSAWLAKAFRLGVGFLFVGGALVSGVQEVVLSKSGFLRSLYPDVASCLQTRQVWLLQTRSLALRISNSQIVVGLGGRDTR